VNRSRNSLAFVLVVAAALGLGAVTGAAERNPYVRDVDEARKALAILSQRTLSRPGRAKRLFVEGYFMRSLVAAIEALPADPPAGIGPALAFADSLVAQQMPHGYWSIGYGTSWLADMGAALGIFPALESHADSTRMRRYQAAAERFVQAMVRDQLIAKSGAIGFGWPVDQSGLVRAWRSDVGWADDPYLISTALVGIELQAWLYRRTGDAAYRDRATAALDYTLSQIKGDGSLPTLVRGEGPYTVAAYVQEGWMAADLLLQDPAVHERLCRRLPAHVDWLLRGQQKDGTWESSIRGDFARTPGIVDFLVWYDQRCEPRRDVQRAVQRASALFVKPERWEAPDKLDNEETREILRALLGRPLAALAAGKPVM
jgi:hypothetical protein